VVDEGQRCLRRGIRFLLSPQDADGFWRELQYTYW
jgi:hypothetical protein